MSEKPTYAELTQRIIKLEQATAALTHQKQRLDYMLQGMNVGTWEWNVQTGETIFNERWAEIIGYTLKEISPVCIDTWIELCHPNDLEESDRLLQVCFSGESEYYQCECRMRHKNGEWIWVLDLGKVATWTADGKPEWMYGTHQDITDRKRAEEEVISAKVFLDTVLDMSPFPMWLSDKEGTIIRTNHSLRETINLTDTEIIGKYSVLNDKNIEKQDLMPMVWGIFEKHQPVRFNIPWKAADAGDVDFRGARDMFIDVSMFPVLNAQGELTNVICQWADITEHKLAEEKLRESEERFRLLAENVVDNIWIMDPQSNRFLYSSPSVERIFGYTPEEAIKLGLAEFLTPESHEQVKLILESELPKLMADPSLSRTLEVDQYRKDGSVISTEITARLVYINWLSSYGILGVTRDITERKQAESAVIHVQRMSAIGELSSGVAHDFNNALQGILGNLELALMGDLSEKARRYIEIATKSAEDAASRVRQLQRFAGKKGESPVYEPVNVRELLEDSIAQTRTLWRDDAQKNGIGIKMNTDCAPELNVLGKEGELRSVVYNLIKNSVQAMPEGGTIDISAKRDGEYVHLTYTDTGTGMDHHTKDRIFQPFFTTKSFEQGSGLGMSGAYAIIKEHKGEIYISHTAPDEGTTFEIKIPCTEKKVAEKDLEKYEGTAKVLWVDDEEMIREAGRKYLIGEGHEVDTASSGGEALELLEKRQYDLMISDVGMSGMSGWQLSEQIKGKYPGMKVAIVTGWGADVTNEQRQKAGVEYVLGKPIEFKSLANLVGKAMQMKGK